jgi:NTE family protein
MARPPCKPGPLRRAGALLALLLALAACRPDPPENAPLPRGESNRGYGLVDLNYESGRSDLVVMAAFSGGGMRSAAFAHGALRGMREIAVPGEDRTLLGALDQVSAVSGGAYAAAHYALHGEASFESFPDAYLHRDVEAYVWGTFLLPWNWSWLFSPSRGTNDRMAEVYDRLLFQGATYAELIRRGRPRLSIGATELTTGATFPFLPLPFDLICSDLSRIQLARAVAASAAFPVLFTPITLQNHRGADCASPLPPFPEPDTLRSDVRMRQLDQQMRRFADPGAMPFIHLVDGGASDNLALRYILTSTAGGGERGEEYFARIRPIRRFVWITVDGQAAGDPTIAQHQVVYGLGRVMNAVSGGQIDNYNIETLALAQSELDRVVARNVENRCAHAPVIEGWPCGDVRGMLVRVSLSEHPDAALRARLQAIRTALSLSREEAALLLRAGEEMVRGAPGLAEFVGRMDER